MNGVSNVSLVFFGETAMHWIEETIKLSSLDFPWFCEILSVRVNFVASEINCFSLIKFVSLLMPAVPSLSFCDNNAVIFSQLSQGFTFFFVKSVFLFREILEIEV